MRWIADRRRTLVVVLLGIGCAPGCQTVSITKVGRDTGPAYRGTRGTPAGWPTPTAEANPTGLPAPLEPLPEVNPVDPAALLNEAEANRRAGVQSAGVSREIATRFELIALNGATAALAAAESDPSSRLDEGQAPAARGLYRAALRDFLRDSSGKDVQLDKKWEARLAAQGVDVRFDPEASAWNPDRFDEFYFADDFAIKGLAHQYKYDGLGVPLVGIRRFRPGELTSKTGEAKFLMPTQMYPVTAVLKPRGPGNRGDGVELASLGRAKEPTIPAAIPPPPGGSYSLELHDPMLERKVEFQGRSEPLAGDLTTSLTYHFVHSPLPILQEIGLLDPQWLEKLAGLYMVHPYTPGRIPVIFVHGLRSSPAAWLKVMNEIRGDPDLRDRYQVWLFMYPTGTPFPYSAAKLRSSLNELRAVVDPEHRDRALDRAVIVGHSMGGLISRMIISSSGQEIWNLIGKRPFDELQASPERKEMLRNVFFFEPHPMITRAVFIATPHGGSELGDEFIGRLADRLIRMPSSLRQTYRALLLQNGREFFTDSVRAGLPSSIDELRRNNKLLVTMGKLPVRPGLEAHSVMGRKNPADSIEQSTDGVVPYGSSHIDWATSELVVPGDHGCQDTPETIEELRRILNLHLQTTAAHRADPEVRPAATSTAAPVAATPRRRPRARIVEERPAPKPDAAKSSWDPVRPAF